MKISWMLFMSVAAVWIALLFWVRQRAINELRANNLTLRQQIDAPVLLPAAVGAPVVQQTNSVLPLNSGEQTELLRLRGQMATLRREMQEMSNRVATLLHSRRPSASVETNPSPSAKQANKDGNIHQAMNEFYRSESYLNAQSLGLALKAYIRANSGELPDGLAKVEASTLTHLPQGISDLFELMRSGVIPEEARSYTLVAREKEPQRLSDGRLIRIYLRGDGGTEIPGTIEPSASPDWTASERMIESLRKQEAQRKQSPRD